MIIPFSNLYFFFFWNPIICIEPMFFASMT
jgi:hypothetical protein